MNSSEMANAFQNSFQRALANDGYNSDFIQSFYDVFVKRSEKIADMFKHTNMSAQKTMLHDSLLYMLEYYKNRKPNELMRHIKKRHGKMDLNVPAEYYDMWLDSLMTTLRRYDPEFDTHVEQAWRSVLKPGIDYMRQQSQP
jgi:hemoglobin-like flavoprotein